MFQRPPHLADASYQSVNWQNPINWNHPLNQGLVGWWLIYPFAMGGTELRDLLGLHHGTLTLMDPASDWIGSIGRPGGWGALDYDGTNDYVVIPSGINDYLNDSNITVMAWIRLRSDMTQYTGVVNEAYLGDSLVRFGIIGNFSGTQAKRLDVAFYNAGWNTLAQSSDLVLNEWTHVCATYDRSNLRLYINGVEDGSSAKTAAMDGTEEWRIGRRWDTAVYFDGLIDDVRIYNRTLSAAAIATHYDLSKVGYRDLLNRWRVPYAAAEEVAAGNAMPMAMTEHNHYAGGAFAA